MYVRDWMSKPVIAIEPDATLTDARTLMDREEVRRLPVVKDGQLVGILTRSDIESAIGRAGVKRMTARMERRSVQDVMTPEPITVTPEETLERAALLMLSRRVSGLPVVEDGKIVGMITETDVFRAMVDILGFNERGARVVIELNSPDALTMWLKKFANGMYVRAVVTYHDPTTRQWKAVVRLRGRRKAAGEPAAVDRA